MRAATAIIMMSRIEILRAFRMALTESNPSLPALIAMLSSERSLAPDRTKWPRSKSLTMIRWVCAFPWLKTGI